MISSDTHRTASAAQRFAPGGPSADPTGMVAGTVIGLAQLTGWVAVTPCLM